jgi:glycosyltransferase involved in cell wall biosynthesis
MKLQKNTFKQFNQSETVLVISDWPQKGKNAKNHGIAWYTKETLEPMAKNYNKKFIVLADNSQASSASSKENKLKPELIGKNILVLRVFDTQRLHLYPQILTWLRVFSKIKNVMIHSEFAAQRGLWHFALLIPFLALIKLTGKKITFYSHNVISDIRSLSGHLNIKPHSFLEKFLNVALAMYYKALAILANQIVVLDESLKERLSAFVAPDKILMFPIPVESKKAKLTQRQAKKKIGADPNKKLLLYFGFVTWYKGADWLVNAFSKTNNKNIELVVAGGESYSLKDKPHYKKYYGKIAKLAATHSNIHLTGFVTEQEIATYFAAADLVVLPYRGLMGSSGTLVHALSYGKPVVFSQEMKPLFVSDLSQQALDQTSLQMKDCLFPRNKQGMKKLVALAHEQKALDRLSQFSSNWAALREKNGLIKREMAALYGNEGALERKSWSQQLQYA